MIPNVILTFKAKTKAERDIPSDPPIILKVRAGVDVIDFGARGPGGNRVLASAAAHGDDRRKRQSLRQTLECQSVCLNPGNFRAGRGRAVQQAGRILPQAKIEVAIKICQRRVDVSVVAHADAKFEEVLAERHGGVILEFIPIQGVCTEPVAVAAARKGPLN